MADTKPDTAMDQIRGTPDRLHMFFLLFVLELLPFFCGFKGVGTPFLRGTPSTFGGPRTRHTHIEHADPLGESGIDPAFRVAWATARSSNLFLKQHGASFTVAHL